MPNVPGWGVLCVYQSQKRWRVLPLKVSMFIQYGGVLSIKKSRKKSREALAVCTNRTLHQDMSSTNPSTHT